MLMTGGHMLVLFSEHMGKMTYGFQVVLLSATVNSLTV